MAHPVSRIEIEHFIDDDGDMHITYGTSDDMSFLEIIGMLEMTKLTVNEESLRPTAEEE